MSKAKDRYSISILLGLLSCVSFIVVTTSPNIDNFILEIIIAFTIGGLMSYGYEIIKVVNKKDVAKKIRQQIIIFGIAIMLFVSVINYFFSSFLASIAGSAMSYLLVSMVYKKY